MTQQEKSYLRKRRAEEALIHAYSRLVLISGGVFFLVLFIIKLNL